MAERTRGGVEKRGEKLLTLVVGERKPEEIGPAGMGVFFVTRRGNLAELKQQIPRRGFGEKFFLAGFLASQFDDIALRTPSGFEKNSDSLRSKKRPVRIVFRKAGQQ